MIYGGDEKSIAVTVQMLLLRDPDIEVGFLLLSKVLNFWKIPSLRRDSIVVSGSCMACVEVGGGLSMS